MKKQVILGLTVMVLLIGLIGSAQAADWTNFTDPKDGDTISGNYSLNVTTNDTCTWVNFSYSIDNDTWIDIGVNDTEGVNFSVYWNTTGLCDGNYNLNATSNRTGYQGYINITVNNNIITLNAPAASETINTGNYTFNATTNATRAWVNFSWSNDSGVTWTEFANNSTEGTVFTVVWNTTNLADGVYDFNATTNCSVEENTTETDESLGVIIDNVPAIAAVVDSPEFSTIMMVALIGLLSISAILLRKKKE